MRPRRKAAAMARPAMAPLPGFQPDLGEADAVSVAAVEPPVAAGAAFPLAALVAFVPAAVFVADVLAAPVAEVTAPLVAVPKPPNGVTDVPPIWDVMVARSETGTAWPASWHSPWPELGSTPVRPFLQQKKPPKLPLNMFAVLSTHTGNVYT